MVRWWCLFRDHTIQNRGHTTTTSFLKPNISSFKTENVPNYDIDKYLSMPTLNLQCHVVEQVESYQGLSLDTSTQLSNTSASHQG